MITTVLSTIFLYMFTLTTVNAVAQNNAGEETNIELKSISPLEKVGYKKLKSSHWISHAEIIIDAN